MLRSIITIVGYASLALAVCSNGKAYQLVTANFDDIKSPNQNKKPYSGYAGLDWGDGGYVQYTPTAYRRGLTDQRQFNGSSLPNILRAGMEQSVLITISENGTISPFRLESFTLGCYRFDSELYLRAHKCSVLVTLGDVFSPISSYIYDYTVGPLSGYPTLLNYTGPSRYSKTVQIQLVGPPEGNYTLQRNVALVLDNIVTRQKCSS